MSEKQIHQLNQLQRVRAFDVVLKVESLLNHAHYLRLVQNIPFECKNVVQSFQA